MIIHRRDAEGAENFNFCLSGDDDKQKHFYRGNNRIKTLKRIFNRRLTQNSEEEELLTAKAQRTPSKASSA